MKNKRKECEEVFVLWQGAALERGAPQVLQGYLLPLMNTSAVLLLCWQVGCAAFLLHNGFNCALQDVQLAELIIFLRRLTAGCRSESHQSAHACGRSLFLVYMIHQVKLLFFFLFGTWSLPAVGHRGAEGSGARLESFSLRRCQRHWLLNIKSSTLKTSAPLLRSAFCLFSSRQAAACRRACTCVRVHKCLSLWCRVYTMKQTALIRIVE